MSNLILVTGGARSGKSRFAELLAQRDGSPVTYVATAQVGDAEMAKRVEKHRQSRPSYWALIEEPYDIAHVLKEHSEANSVILLDCVTLWLSNLLLKEIDVVSSDLTIEAQESTMGKILDQVKEVAELAENAQGQVILVTNEVGQGIVPDNPLSRLYRDLAGRANQILAKASEQAYLVVAGYPLEIKTSGEALLRKLKRED